MPNSLTSTFKKARMPVLVAIGMAYFGFHLMNGERGVYAYFRESHQQSALKDELADLIIQREKMERKVVGLRSGSLDRDLLDEQARDMLGLMGDDETLILLDP